MNFNEMAAGPEMDRLIAEMVMWWSLRPDPMPWNEYSKDGQPIRAVGHWSPSTNIAHAWEVLGHLKNGEMHIIPLLEDRATHWTAELHSLRHRWRVGPMSGDTAPLAICRAALLATNPKEE